MAKHFSKLFTESEFTHLIKSSEITVCSRNVKFYISHLFEYSRWNNNWSNLQFEHLIREKLKYKPIVLIIYQSRVITDKVMSDIADIEKK